MKFLNLKKNLIIFWIIAVIWAIGGCQPTNFRLSQSPRAQEIRQVGKLVAITSLDFPPLLLRDPKTGKVVGFEVDIADAIAAKIGVPIEWNDSIFADVLPSLQAGKADLAVAGITVTPERLKIVDFSDRYLHSGTVIVTLANNTAIRSSQDLKGSIVAVEKGTTNSQYAQQLRKEGINLTVREYENEPDPIQEVLRGYADAALLDRIPAIEYIKKYPELKIARDVIEPANIAIAVKKGDTELLKIINRVLLDLRANGQLDSLYKKWFGSAQIKIRESREDINRWNSSVGD